jgi:hypothetical protein
MHLIFGSQVKTDEQKITARIAHYLFNKSLELTMVGNGGLMSEINVCGSDKSVSPQTSEPISSFPNCCP